MQCVHLYFAKWMLDSWSKGWRPRTKPYLYTSVYIKALAIQRKKKHNCTQDYIYQTRFGSAEPIAFCLNQQYAICQCQCVFSVFLCCHTRYDFLFLILHLPFIIYEVLLESICPSRLKCLPSRWLLCNTHSIRVETTTASLPQHRLRFSGFALMKALRAFCWWPWG